MNQRLANRLHELEVVRSGKEKPIMYLWADPNQDTASRIIEAALANPDKKIISIGWLNNQETIIENGVVIRDDCGRPLG